MDKNFLQMALKIQQQDCHSCVGRNPELKIFLVAGFLAIENASFCIESHGWGTCFAKEVESERMPRSAKGDTTPKKLFKF